MFARRKIAFICFIVVFFVISVCVNSYAAQIAFADSVPDIENVKNTESFGRSAMCVPPENDSTERNEKLTSSNDLYIRLSKTESMIFCSSVSIEDCTDIKSNTENNVSIKDGESLIGQVIMRC